MGGKGWRLVYPKVYRDTSCKEVLHSVEVADPYRWLEDPDSLATKEFIAAQNQVTEAYLGQNTDRADAMRVIVENLYNHPKLSTPFRRGKFYYYFYNPGLLPQSVLYQLDTLDSEPTEFFNVTPTSYVLATPNTLSEDGTVALSTYAFSEDGHYFAYGTSQSGSDWVSVRILEVATRRVLEDKLDWIKFSTLSWTGDNRGFFYSRYPERGQAMGATTGTETDSVKGQQVFYHRLETKQADDVLVFEDPSNPDHFVSASTSHDSQRLILTISCSCDPVNKVYLARLHEGTQAEFSLEGVDFGNVEFVRGVDNFEAGYEYVTNEGAVLYFHTNLHAPNYRVVKLDAENLSAGFVEVIPESAALLETVTCVSDKLLALVYLENVVNHLQLHDLGGSSSEGSPMSWAPSRRSQDGGPRGKFFFCLAGFLNPGIIYHCTLCGDPRRLSDAALAKYLEGTLTSEQNTHVPRSEGGRSFGPAAYPPVRLRWLQHFDHPRLLAILAFVHYLFDGLVCIPNIRGGGEFGDEWHRQGILEKKQRGFDDFQDAARFLIREGLTTAPQLTINGGSNGGLLVGKVGGPTLTAGVAITQAPQLFGCAIADVGVLDMLRFHKFTVGHAWKSDYGDPDNPHHFKHLLEYSPLHNVRDACRYPPTLLATASHDDRLAPAYLQVPRHPPAPPGRKPGPLLGRIETKAGHGAGKPTQKKIDECVDKLSFIALAMRHNHKAAIGL
ncbi:hypothetical protein L0F63_005341 [Massospora cicadina]|nr:hypothetical protein L0F63_005341 [Massospora cicadina]